MRASDPLIWTVGDVRVTKILEEVIPTTPADLLPTSDPAVLDRHRQWLVPDFVDEDGNLLVSAHMLIVESRGRRIVVDTCVGNGKVRPFPGWSDLHTDFLDRFTGAGFPPETIDTVVCTHLHFDHVGWNTRRGGGRWAPTFPTARYLFGRVEWDYWRTASGPDTAAGTSSLDDSVRPVFDAGLVDLVEPGQRITDEVRLEPTPGHTPGHQSVRITSAGDEGVITGDVIHHPVQIAEVDWVGEGDFDPVLATSTRRAFLDGIDGRAVLVIGSHFAGPTAGHAVRDGRGWRFDPV